MAYAQAERKFQTSYPDKRQSVQTAGGRTNHAAGNSVVQAKLKVGGSSTPAEAEADRVASQVMQGGTSQSGIPVTQSVSGGTVQRDFLGFKKRFQKAVDERNENYDEYKKASKWQRFKWAVANPLAWTFGRLGANKRNTEERAERRAMVDRLALQGDEKAEKRMAHEDKRARKTYASQEEEGVGDKILGLATSVAPGIKDIKNLKNDIGNSRDAAEAGDDFGMGMQGAKTVDDMAQFTKNALNYTGKAAKVLGHEIPGVTRIVPGLGIASGVAKMGMAGAEMIRAGVTRSRTTEGMNESQTELADLQERLAAAKEANDTDAQKEIEAAIKRSSAMNTLMNRGHNTAVIDQWNAAGDMLTGAIDTAGGVAELSGVGTVGGLALSAASAALDKGKGWWIERKRRKARKAEIKKELGLDDKGIEAIQAEYKERGIKLSKSEVKRMVLLRHGSRSYEEAYMRSISDKKKAVGEGGMKKVGEALGVENADSKAGDTLINKRLGVEEKYAGNLREGIRLERAKKMLPSFMQ